MAKRKARRRCERQQLLIDTLHDIGAARLWESDDPNLQGFTLEGWIVGNAVVIFEMFFDGDGRGQGWQVWYPSSGYSMADEFQRMRALASTTEDRRDGTR